MISAVDSSHYVLHIKVSDLAFKISNWRPTENFKEQYYAYKNKGFNIRERFYKNFIYILRVKLKP